MDPNLNVPASKLPPHMHENKKDFRESFHWRVFRILSEFVEGFQFIFDFKKSVTFFGSARLTPENHWYQEAEKLGQLLAKSGFTVITGGGPGIMEAANKGAFEKGGESVGINIQLEQEQRINPYVKKGVGMHYFFTRKVMLTYSSWAYVYFPGGYGTLDEFLEIVTLVQTKKICAEIPLVLVGKEFWSGLLEWIDNIVYKNFDAINKEDMNLFTLVDTAEEAYTIIKDSKERREFLN
jgi:uncharacterized protein (TIGR00730 family)